MGEQAGGEPVPVDMSRVREVLAQVLAIVRSGPQDVTWQSRYRDDDELVADLIDHLERATSGDTSRLGELKLLFAPTGALCEIAISSGWSQEYAELGNRLDRLLDRPSSR